MSAQRIKTGFRRIGIVIGVLIAAPSFVAMLMGIPIATDWVPQWGAKPSEWYVPVAGGAGFLVVAFLGYLAARTLGWIISGFVGDD